MNEALLVLTPSIELLRPMLADAYRLVGWGDEGAASDLAAARAIVVAGHEPLPQGLFEACPHLGLIACFTAGYERIDVMAALSRGIGMSHAPAVNQEDVADHALAMIMASRRGIVSGDRLVRQQGWRTRESFRPSRSLSSAKVGIVGLGAIGRALAERCAALRMAVRWWGPRPQEADWPMAASLPELATWSDVLVLCARADESNRKLISRPILEALGPQGLLVNISRGQIVDEEALIDLLRSGGLGDAALDVFDPEPTTAQRWSGIENVILTPHMAGVTIESMQALVDLLRLNLRRFFAGEPLATPVPEMAGRQGVRRA